MHNISVSNTLLWTNKILHMHHQLNDWKQKPNTTVFFMPSGLLNVMVTSEHYCILLCCHKLPIMGNQSHGNMNRNENRIVIEISKLHLTKTLTFKNSCSYSHLPIHFKETIESGETIPTIATDKMSHKRVEKSSFRLYDKKTSILNYHMPPLNLLGRKTVS
jgi:hypothetical protein